MKFVVFGPRKLPVQWWYTTN